MEFALLFIIAFIIGAAIYAVGNGWLVSVLVPIAIFCVSVLVDSEAREAWSFSLLFGVPLVFFASLLGTYIVQLRRPDQADTFKEQKDQEGPNNAE